MRGSINNIFLVFIHLFVIKDWFELELLPNLGSGRSCEKILKDVYYVYNFDCLLQEQFSLNYKIKCGKSILNLNLKCDLIKQE